MTETVVSSARKEVVIGFERPFVIIGERINPTGRKVLAAEMAAGDFSRVKMDAVAQVESGAHMLDVNAGIPLADEPAILAEAVQLASHLAPDLDTGLLVDVGNFAVADARVAELPSGLSAVEAAAIILAKAAATSPSGVNEITISTVMDHLEPAQIVEIMLWLSLLQMLHRLYAFYDARIGIT